VLPFPQAEAHQDIAGGDVAFEKVMGKGHSPITPLPLIKKLCETLNAQQISYCHWKSNWKLRRWLGGDGDLDLLVDRRDAQRFVGLIQCLGFKQAEPSSDRMLPGILNFYGFDSDAGRFVHLHVHYQLVIGHDLTKNYHLPIEQLYLENVTRAGMMPVPTPEFEIIVFVLRMVLKHSSLESILRRRFSSSTSGINAVERELEELKARVDQARVFDLLPEVVPGIDPDFFKTCEQSLRTGFSLRSRSKVRRQLQRSLRSFARRPQFQDALLKAYRGVARTMSQSVLHRRARKRFMNGGLLIAVVGGDGAGKTTALIALNDWLSKKFVTKRFHVGKPPRSALTLICIVLLRVRRLLAISAVHSKSTSENEGTAPFPGYVQLVRWACAARDRCRLYTKARRLATHGGIALCDRYPVPQLHLMEGANISRLVEPKRRNALVRRLLKAEADYYARIMAPDLLIVLRVDPEIAVRRKTSESEHHVRSRAQELWEKDWEGSGAYVVDAGQPAEDVVAQLQSIIWAKL
jgi:thymidylate kinase